MSSSLPPLLNTPTFFIAHSLIFVTTAIFPLFFGAAGYCSAPDYKSYWSCCCILLPSKIRQGNFLFFVSWLTWLFWASLGFFSDFKLLTLLVIFIGIPRARISKDLGFLSLSHKPSIFRGLHWSLGLMGSIQKHLLIFGEILMQRFLFDPPI